jgi:hypothetical protein
MNVTRDRRPSWQLEAGRWNLEPDLTSRTPTRYTRVNRDDVHHAPDGLPKADEANPQAGGVRDRHIADSSQQDHQHPPARKQAGGFFFKQ